ncbi:ROK family transcriptional regulator [Actinomycetaceae bacterium L2_0104]
MAISQARHWRTAARALSLLRHRSEMTRTELANQLGLRSGPVSDLVKRLVQAELVCEKPAALQGPGRPTSTIHAHPSGPNAVVLDLRHGDWRLGTCQIDGSVSTYETGRYRGSAPEQYLAALGKKVRELVETLEWRAVGVGIVVPGRVVDGHLDMTMQRWSEIDTSPLTSATDLPVFLLNDATAAGIAETRMHPPELKSLLHIVVEIGVGGALIVEGQPTPSAHNLHGEFGHLPFGDPTLTCPCGARGCWTIAFDVSEISRRTGLVPNDDPRIWLHRIFTHPNESDSVRAVVSSLASDLGRGIAGLTNALDPGLISLGGMAEDLRLVAPNAFDQSFADGLMNVHRRQPPPIIAAQSGELAALVGAGVFVFDEILDATSLASWVSQFAPSPSQGRKASATRPQR